MKEFFLSKTRLISFLTILLICTFTFSSLFSYNVTKEAINRETKTETLPLISDNIFSEIQRELLTPINNSSLMANDEFLIDWVQSGETDTAEVTRYLQRIKEKYGYFSSFFVSEMTGNYYYYDGILKKIDPTDEHDVWYFRFRDLNTEYELDVDTDEATQGTLTIFINHRLEDQEGRFLGVTGVGLKMDTVGKMLAAYQERFGNLIYMIDSDGLIEIHPDPALVETVNIKDIDGIATVRDEILSHKEGTQIYEFRSTQGDMVISARYLADMEWFLIVEQNQTQSLQQARAYLIGNIIVGILVTLLVILLVIWVVNLYNQKLESLAIIDELTGLYNRRKFQEILQREISIAQRFHQPLSLLMIDVDHFKSVNDDYGHPAGDEVLKTLAHILKREIREIDMISRWGGEEFLILLHKTNREQTYSLAERLREIVLATPLKTPRGTITLTISIGIAGAESGNLKMDEMIKLADDAMYRAKQQGRNRTCSIPSAELTPDPTHTSKK